MFFSRLKELIFANNRVGGNSKNLYRLSECIKSIVLPINYKEGKFKSTLRAQLKEAMKELNVKADAFFIKGRESNLNIHFICFTPKKIKWPTTHSEICAVELYDLECKINKEDEKEFQEAIIRKDFPELRNLRKIDSLLNKLYPIINKE